MGNHIDVETGQWTALDSGIGAGVDSYFEYLVKGSILFQYPELMQMFRGITLKCYGLLVGWPPWPVSWLDISRLGSLIAKFACRIYTKCSYFVVFTTYISRLS